MLIMLFISPFQPFIETHYSLFQVVYISFVLIIINIIMYFYKQKMDESKELILRQQEELKIFNDELQKANNLLELKVNELLVKDKLISAQSKQAVMGEMISMIAHQWRQPLSTITLQISNLHFKKVLGKNISEEENDKVLSEISDNILYLSETIDDFQTYFRPNKERSTVEIHELLQKAINFALARTKELDIEIINTKYKDLVISTYMNELIQVVLNLINNAIDAFIEKDKKGAKLSIHAEENSDTISIFIKDNADGISDENLPHIFEPYFSTKAKNGTGLGLYMSQMIVEKQFGGRIKVKSSPSGTTFIVEILKEI